MQDIVRASVKVGDRTLNKERNVHLGPGEGIVGRRACYRDGRVTGRGVMVSDTLFELSNPECKAAKELVRRDRPPPREDSTYLFTVRVNLERGKLLEVHAFENLKRRSSTGHTYLDLEAVWMREVLFPKGTMFVGIPSHQTIDGKYAKRCALDCVAMRPGDTDSDYFRDYTPEQLAWAEAWGEQIQWEIHARFGEG